VYPKKDGPTKRKFLHLKKASLLGAVSQVRLSGLRRETAGLGPKNVRFEIEISPEIFGIPTLSPLYLSPRGEFFSCPPRHPAHSNSAPAPPPFQLTPTPTYPCCAPPPPRPVRRRERQASVPTTRRRHPRFQVSTTYLPFRLLPR
jgi:hypothetical protein